ncbi:MAG: hypothetical protein PF481_10995 [Bacteroidales bacterium]|jgi:hypothetical protein|nr:hypothetical protein [Bacteroidales bacterium]
MNHTQTFLIGIFLLFSQLIFANKLSDSEVTAQNLALSAQHDSLNNGQSDSTFTNDSLSSSENTSLEKGSESTGIPWKKIIYIVIITYSLLFLYMIYQLLFKRKWFVPLSKTETDNDEDTTTPAKKHVWDKLYTIWGEWHYSHIDENDEEIRIPPHHSAIKKALKTFETISESETKDSQIIAFINKMGNIINSHVTRRFNGSWLILVTSLILPIGYILINYYQEQEVRTLSYLLLSPAFLYFISCFTPKFVLDSRKKGEGLSGIQNKIHRIFYTNLFSTNEENSNQSKHKINAVFSVLLIIIVIAVTLVLSLVIALIGTLINFFRNYLLI